MYIYIYKSNIFVCMNIFDLNFILILGLLLECTMSKTLLIISCVTRIFTLKTSAACFYRLR